MGKIAKLKHYWSRRDDAEKYFKWVLNYSKPYIPQLSLLLAFDLIATLTSVGMAIIGKELIDKATGGHLSELWSIIIIYVLIIFGNQILTVVSELIAVVVYEKFGFAANEAQRLRRYLEV